jgi:hypothetical protein
MHGYAHNRKCQLGHHPKYTSGAGIEDFETCERLFSISNNCASISRYATRFHRHQILDTHFSDSDHAHRLAIGRFLYNNYRQALDRIANLSALFTELGLTENILEGLYQGYLAAEAAHLNTLSYEPLEEQSRFNYVDALEKWWVAKEAFAAEARKFGLSTAGVISSASPLPPVLKAALMRYNETHAVAQHFEQVLGIPVRWEFDSHEYKEARTWSNERKYRLALDRLERLVIQRIFELQKANLVSTGEVLLSHG